MGSQKALQLAPEWLSEEVCGELETGGAGEQRSSCVLRAEKPGSGVSLCWLVFCCYDSIPKVE